MYFQGPCIEAIYIISKVFILHQLEISYLERRGLEICVPSIKRKWSLISTQHCSCHRYHLIRCQNKGRESTNYFCFFFYDLQINTQFLLKLKNTYKNSLRFANQFSSAYLNSVLDFYAQFFVKIKSLCLSKFQLHENCLSKSQKWKVKSRQYM